MKICGSEGSQEVHRVGHGISGLDIDKKEGKYRHWDA